MPDSASFPGPRRILILGRTVDGKAFRPSDWGERLAGVMSQFRPDSVAAGVRVGYSPWCSPSAHGGMSCVVAHKDLSESEPMAWDFLLNFARDNGLVLQDGDLPGSS